MQATSGNISHGSETSSSYEIYHSGHAQMLQQLHCGLDTLVYLVRARMPFCWSTTDRYPNQCLLSESQLPHGEHSPFKIQACCGTRSNPRKHPVRCLTLNSSNHDSTHSSYVLPINTPASTSLKSSSGPLSDTAPVYPCANNQLQPQQMVLYIQHSPTHTQHSLFSPHLTHLKLSIAPYCFALCTQTSDRDSTHPLAQLVKICLQHLLPWKTPCLVKNRASSGGCAT